MLNNVIVTIFVLAALYLSIRLRQAGKEDGKDRALYEVVSLTWLAITIMVVYVNYMWEMMRLSQC